MATHRERRSADSRESAQADHDAPRRSIDASSPPAVPILAAQQQMLDLQRTAGNEAVNRLVVGAADDQAERDADARADRAIAALAADGAPAAAGAGGHGGAPAAHRSIARRSGGGSGASGAIGLAGGELDDGSTEQIRRRLGGGHQLPSQLSATFGSALGADVSAARIHDDAVSATLARRMSARAFTVGRDVFFGEGAYRPGTEGGDHVLAHELAHVVQNGPDAQPAQRLMDEAPAQRMTVRRAIGFEFETNIPVRKTTSVFLGLGSKKVPLKKMEVIEDYVNTHGFRMEADENSSLGSTIEFVVRPAIEENNRAGLLTAMTEMVRIATAIGQAAPALGSTDMTPGNAIHTIEPTVGRQDVVVFPRAVTANPQATIGLAMNKVHEVSSTLTKADAQGGTAGRRLMASTHSTASATAAGNEAQLAARPELRGLVTLLASYIRRGSSRSANQPLNYAKLVSGSMMVRTDFGSYFNRLPLADRTWAQGGAHPGDNFVDVVLRVAGETGGGDGAKRVFERGVRKSNKTRKDGSKSNKKSTLRELRISRDRWLREIANGTDELAAAFARQKAKDELEGLGRLGNAFDKVGAEVGTAAQGTGVVIEMREMAQNVAVGQWRQMALDIFDEVVATNAPPVVAAVGGGGGGADANDSESESDSGGDGDGIVVEESDDVLV